MTKKKSAIGAIHRNEVGVEAQCAIGPHGQITAREDVRCVIYVEGCGAVQIGEEGHRRPVAMGHGGYACTGGVEEFSEFDLTGMDGGADFIQ